MRCSLVVSHEAVLVRSWGVVGDVCAGCVLVQRSLSRLSVISFRVFFDEIDQIFGSYRSTVVQRDIARASKKTGGPDSPIAPINRKFIENN